MKFALERVACCAATAWEAPQGGRSYEWPLPDAHGDLQLLLARSETQSQQGAGVGAPIQGRAARLLLLLGMMPSRC